MKKAYTCPKCGIFENVRQRSSRWKNVSVEAIVAAIKKEKWKPAIEAIRALVSRGTLDSTQEARVKKLKGSLPAFMPSASTNGSHKKMGCTAHTGVIGIDVDNIGCVVAIAARARMAEDPHILAAWLSPRGAGLKILIRVDATLQTHATAWSRATRYVVEKYGLVADPSQKGVNSLCFVGSDPDLVMRRFAETLPLPGTAGGFVHSISVTQETQVTQVTQTHSCLGVGGEGETAFDATPFLVTGGGQSNKALFTMARHLKTHEKKRGRSTTWEEREAIFNRWWPPSAPYVDPNLDYAAFMGKWQHAYESAQYAADERPLELAWKLTVAHPLPPPALAPNAVSNLMQEKDSFRKLIALCYYLQKLRGDLPFFLGCRDAANLLGVPTTTVNYWLLLLANPKNPNRCLELIRKGSYAAKLANEYRFLFDQMAGRTEAEGAAMQPV
ncbi:MAG TPA: BT4734/BF3469 family protein [Verrucomicrobiales bacterium]|nr:BT4734/BF3469 family protein [Verrucomicrobiales bacterium]